MHIRPVWVPGQHLQKRLQMPVAYHPAPNEQLRDCVRLLGKPVPGRIVVLVQLIIKRQADLQVMTDQKAIAVSQIVFLHRKPEGRAVEV